MELSAIYIGNCVGYYMTVKMVPVLMDCNDTLMLREKFICKCSSYLKNFCGRNLLVLMKTNDIVGYHSSRVFIPTFLFIEPGLINSIIVNCGFKVGSGYIKIAFFHLFILKDVLYGVPHACVIFSGLIDDLIDSHALSCSFR